MDDDQSTEKAEGPHSITGSQTTPARLHANGSHGAWARLKAMFSSDRDASLRESLQGVIEQHGTSGGGQTIRDQERSMMLNLLEFADLRVDDVMVPRADIIAVEDVTTVSALLAKFVEANHSRLPVYHETLDDPLGMVHVKDLLRWLTKPGKSRRGSARSAESENGSVPSALNVSAKNMNASIKQSGLIREVLFVPPSMRAGDLLVKMQTSHIHMAIVVDEYGGTDGLASIEDLVEEIVGDISDEHDDEEAAFIRPGEAGVFTADARAPIEEVEALLGVDLLPDEREEDADTLGGLVFSMLGRVPVRGELIKHDSGIEFEVIGADPRRVKRLKIHARGHAARPPREPAAPNN